MQTSPNENVKLTFEQMQQIDVVEKRLANLQIEVSLATKLLTETRLDSERLTKERIYQNGLLSDLLRKVEEADLKYGKLLEDIKTSEDGSKFEH